MLRARHRRAHRTGLRGEWSRPHGSRNQLRRGGAGTGPGGANATIGRALRLIWVDVGGAISTSTFGNPARYACCFGGYEEESGWEPLHVEHGFSPATARSRRSPASRSRSSTTPRAAAPPTCLRPSPGAFRWSPTKGARPAVPVGSVPEAGARSAARPQRRRRAPRGDARVLLRRRERHDADPEVPRPRGNLKLVVADGTAGRFSAIIPGRERLDDTGLCSFPCQISVREILGLDQLQESVPKEKLVVPIIKSTVQFIQIGVKVLHADLVVRADDRTFQKAVHEWHR